MRQTMLEEQVQEVLQNYQLKNEKAITFGHPKVKMNWILPLPGLTVTSFDQFQPFFVYFDESGISFLPLDMNQNYRAIGRSFLAWNDMDHFQFKKGLLEDEIQIQLQDQKMVMKLVKKKAMNSWIKENNEYLIQNHHFYQS